MKLSIIALGQKMPDWVEQAFDDYQKRFTRDFPCSLTEVPLQKRTKTSAIDRLVQDEGLKVLKLLAKDSITIALDVKGKEWSTEQLAAQLSHFKQNTSCINFIIGGPDGLSEEILKTADYCWSLSPLTFPHPLVRIILIEQLYRAISILQNHPYHRS
jgi:23S rRNA (pseudouridine1915-N3)-methyltransferase